MWLITTITNTPPLRTLPFSVWLDDVKGKGAILHCTCRLLKSLLATCCLRPASRSTSPYLDCSITATLSVWHIAWLDDSADAKKILTALRSEDWKRPAGRPWITWMKTGRDLAVALGSHGWRLEETCRSPSDHMDEDSPKRPWVQQSHIDWSSHYGSESPTLEIDGCEWRYALIVVQTSNDNNHKHMFLTAMLVCYHSHDITYYNS